MPKPPRVITNGPAASRAKALAAMTKAELIKTIKALDKRQTQLLNEVQFEREKSSRRTQAVATELQREIAANIASQAVATALQREVADLKAGFKPNRNVASTAKYDPGFAKAADELRGASSAEIADVDARHVTPPPAMVFPWDKPNE